jgi:hypothetical protein
MFILYITHSCYFTLHVQALADALRTLGTRGTVDTRCVATAIMHELKLQFAKPVGEWKGPPPVEAWDSKSLQWLHSCGDDRLLLAVSDALRKTMPRVSFIEAIHQGKVLLEPTAMPPDERFGDMTGFVAKIAKTAIMLLEPQRVLDDEDACRHMIHFSCGRTLHFNKPFDEQLQWGQLEDRASRSTGNPFVEWQPAEGVREKVKVLCDELNAAWANSDFTIDVEKPEGLAQALAANSSEGLAAREMASRIQSGLECILPHSDLLKLLYPSHNTWDPTMFELRQFARGASGCQLFEEFLIYLGRTGSNRKTTTLKLLAGTFGSSNKQGSRGYVCTQKAKYFEGKDTKNAAEPDEGVAAMKGARFVVVDEFSGISGHFNHTLVKQWSDADGTPIPFERKYGARDEIKPSWLMVWFTNVLPSFFDADQAFARRLTILPMYVAFKAAEDLDASNCSHMLADNNMRARAASFGPELLYWIRCLVSGLYSRADTTVLRPRPRIVQDAIDEEVDTILAASASNTAATSSLDVKARFFTEKLVACNKGDVPTSTKKVHEAFVDFTGISKKDTVQCFVAAGFKAKTVTVGGVNTWAYTKDSKSFKMV